LSGKSFVLDCESMAVGAVPVEDPLLRFGPFELNIIRRTIYRDGIRLKLQQQPFSVLELLLERAPEIVSREEIRRYVWGDHVHVDAEQGIAFCIRQIRSVLGDHATSPRYIQTIPRQGFRFMAAVERPSGKGATDERSVSARPAFSPGAEVEVISSLPISDRRKLHRWLLGSFLATTLLTILGGIVFRLSRQNEPLTVSQVHSVTTYPGSERHPNFSPDGQQITFSWDGEGTRSIYVAVPGGDRPLRLTQSPSDDDFPVWSPDGKSIAFLRWHHLNHGELMLIPALGGVARRLHSVEISHEIASTSSMLAWSPDSHWICFTSREEQPGSREILRLVSPETGESRPLFAATNPNASDSSPAFSPDGRWLAFARFAYPYNTTLLLQRLSSAWKPLGDPIAVRGAGTNPLSPVWTKDSHTLFFLDGPSRLMQADIGAGRATRPARQIYVANAPLEGLSLDGTGRHLLTANQVNHGELWTLPLRAGGLKAAGAPQKILISRASEYLPEYSPDGRWLTFISTRTGSPEVWLASSKGENPRPLTHLNAHIVGFPRWSPDGQSIAFHARVPAIAELYVIRVADGVLRQVTQGLPAIAAPSWSSDGRFLYGLGPRNGSEFLFRISLASGAREPLWDGVRPNEVPGRPLLLYAKIGQRGIFARHLSDRAILSEEQKLVDDYLDPGGGFFPVESGFYYSAYDPAGRPRALCFYSFAAQKAVDIAAAPKNFALGLSVSPDGKTLAYAAAGPNEADLILLELNRYYR